LTEIPLHYTLLNVNNKTFPVCLLLIGVFLFVTIENAVFALEPSVINGIAIPLVTNEKNISEGQIISYDGKSMERSKSEYDKMIYGVTVMDPDLAITDLDRKDQAYVLSNGRASVKVSSKNGSIQVNDYITSSDEPGVGMRATEDGTVLGTALEAFDKDGVGVISVQVSPHTEVNISDEHKSRWNPMLLVIIFFVVDKLILR